MANNELPAVTAKADSGMVAAARSGSAAAVARTQAAHAPAQPKIDAPSPKEMAQQIKEALQQLNDAMKSSGQNLAFSKDSASGRTVIRVTNTETGELVRQIPNETLLKVARSIEEFKGAIWDEKI